MSAEVVLRRAASRIHHDVNFDQAHGDDTFLVAVAELLNVAADLVEPTLNAFDRLPPHVDNLLDVARAYLGETA